MAEARRDANYITTMLGVSNADGVTPVVIWADPTTHRLLVDLPAGSGTVTSVSVVTANGVSGTVATPTTTPAITLTLGSITPSAVQVSGLTASEIVGTDASKNLVSLAVATYPSLTELTFLKGVTSAIQTQITAKMTNPMTTGGDLIYGGASGVATRLANGTAGQVLQSNGTTLAPTWAAAGAGDMILASAQTNSGIKTFLNTTMKLRNVANTFDGYFVNTNTVDRIYTFQDRNGTIADNADLSLKANLASPTFTGTVTIPTPFTIGAVSMTATGTELNYIVGVTSAIQTQLNAKQASDATLTSIAALGTAADKTIYTTAIDTWAETPLTAFGRSLIDDADAITARTTLGLVIGTNVQAWDADLDTWATKTAPSGVVLGTTDTQTLTNKRITPRSTTEASSATPTINTDNVDAHSITALAVAITSMTTNLSGTPTNFQKLIIRILDNGTARAITWGASFVAKGVALPTITVISKLLTVGFIYDTVSVTWGCVASNQES